MAKGGERMFNVTQYAPKLRVTAWRGTTKYDLTPYIMQARTSKDIGQPMGQWALLLTYQVHWHKLLSPMDYVEIAMSRYHDTPQVIMRGFVTNLRITKTMSENGQFRRTITINGNDYGKLFEDYQIYYAANQPGQTGTGSDQDPAQYLLAPMLQSNFGMFNEPSNDLVPLNELVPQFVQYTIQPWIKALQKNTPDIPNISAPKPNVLSDYQLNWLSLQSMRGSVANIINEYANVPWCEWFVYDTPTEPKVIHRNTPFKSATGAYIFQDSELRTAFSTITVTDEETLQFDIGRTDSEVADYFFTYPTMFTGGDLAYKYAVIGQTKEFAGNGLGAEANLYSPTNPKVLESQVYRYGMRIMETATPAIPVVTDKNDPQGAKLSIKLNMWNVFAFGWAEDMYNGTIQIRGNENITIGRYVFLKDEGIEGYVQSVDQVFTVSQPSSRGNDNTFSFQTTLGITRGRDTKKPDSGLVPSNLLNFGG